MIFDGFGDVSFAEMIDWADLEDWFYTTTSAFVYLDTSETYYDDGHFEVESFNAGVSTGVVSLTDAEYADLHGDFQTAWEYYVPVAISSGAGDIWFG